MRGGYEQGETPNPCIDCNRYIKFGKMLERAKLLGFDYIATGHYARVGIRRGKRAVAAEKGGGYLKRPDVCAVFPDAGRAWPTRCFRSAGCTKAEVRKMAEERGFVNARKPDSEDICFVPDGNYAGFLENVMGLQQEPGNFVDTAGTCSADIKG